MKKIKKGPNGQPMITQSDTIEMGEYAGWTLENCIKWCGRKCILKIMKYYYIPDEILRDYHFHKITPEEKVAREQKKTPSQIKKKVSDPIGETFKVTINELLGEINLIDTLEEPGELYSSQRNFYKESVLYDSEDDPADSFFGNYEGYPQTNSLTCTI